MAAGPKIILQEFLRDAEKAKHALGYAPGCDYISDNMKDWQVLNDLYSQLIEEINSLLLIAPEGSVEQIRARISEVKP